MVHNMGVTDRRDTDGRCEQAGEANRRTKDLVINEVHSHMANCSEQGKTVPLNIPDLDH